MTTVEALPDPLVAAEVDLRSFLFMPLDVVRLRDSGIARNAAGEEFRAAVLLWCASWHQVPAASLPDVDSELAHLAGFGRSVREWKRYRGGALRGWVKCSDGRLYHPVVAEKANETWMKHLEFEERRLKRIAAAKAGADGRWHSGEHCESDLEDVRDAIKQHSRRIGKAMRSASKGRADGNADDRKKNAEREEKVSEVKGTLRGIADRNARGVDPPDRPPPDPEAGRRWGEIVAAMKRHVTQQCLDTWFRPVTAIGFDGSTLTISVPNETFRKWFKENYLDKVKAVAGIAIAVTAEAA